MLETVRCPGAGERLKLMGYVMESGSFFVGWGGLALINAALANLGHRGPLKYFLGSLLLGPVITLLLAATREDAKGDLRQVDLWTGRDIVKRNP